MCTIEPFRTENVASPGNKLREFMSEVKRIAESCGATGGEYRSIDSYLCNVVISIDNMSEVTDGLMFEWKCAYKRMFPKYPQCIIKLKVDGAGVLIICPRFYVPTPLLKRISLEHVCNAISFISSIVILAHAYIYYDAYFRDLLVRQFPS